MKEILNLEVQHIEIHVSSLERAKDFYVTKLGLEIIEDTPSFNVFAVRAGGVRISIFGGYEPVLDLNENRAGTHIIFRTDNILKTIDELLTRNCTYKGNIFEAPGFIKGITLNDPDGNVIEIAEYFRDPLKPQRHLQIL